MSFTLAIAFAGFPPGTCYPSTPAELAAMITEQLQVTGFGDLNTFNYGPSIPSPDLQDRPWIKTDAENNLIGLFTYADGQWVTSYPYNTGDMKIYNAALTTAVAPWYDCNGQTVVVNGVSYTLPNLMGTVPICKGQRTLPSGSTDTATNFTAGGTGGKENISITSTDQLFAHTHPSNAAPTPSGGINAGIGGGPPYFANSGISQGYSTGLGGGQLDVNGNPLPGANIPSLPPYFVLGFAMFIDPNA